MKPRYKLKILITSIFVITGLSIIGWFWGARQFKNMIEEKIYDFASKGQNITCDNLEIRGFPFRVGLFCHRLTFDDHAKQLGFTAQEFQTTARIYQPGHVISQLNGPLMINTRTHQIEASWDNLQASILIDSTNIPRSSIEGIDMNIRIKPVFSSRWWDIITDSIQLHVRQNNGNLDIAASSREMQINTQPENPVIPLKEMSFFATVLGQADILQHIPDKPPFLLRGSNFMLHELTIKSLDDIRISVSGTLQVSQEGLVNGHLVLTLNNIKQLQTILEKNNSKMMREFANINTLLMLFSSLNDQNERTINLTFRKGQIQVGSFPLAMIPAL